MLQFFLDIWDWLNNLSSSTKTLIIIILLFLYTPYLVIKYQAQQINKAKIESEDYSMRTGPMINTRLNNILYADQKVSNVILVNYHNTKENPEGYSFKYLSALGEVSKDRQLRQQWRDLDYITYSQEILRIHNRGYIRCDSIQELITEFPMLYSKLRDCDTKAAAIYPIQGINRPLGLLIMLYKCTPEYYLGYYQQVVAKPLQEIASILDYNNMKDKW